MTGTEISAVLVAIGGVVTGVASAYRNVRNDRRSDGVRLIEGYQGMVEELRVEVDRLRRLHEEERAAWEREKEAMHAEIDTLKAQVAALLWRSPDARTREDDFPRD